MKAMNVVLVVIYNHRYDKNIDKVEKIYSGRFSTIFHLVPFYDGTRKNVIPVYENSRRFQGYVSQGFNRYFDTAANHYFFIGDDLILNPLINEANYQQVFSLDSRTSFIPNLVELHRHEPFWHRVRESYLFKLQRGGVEVINELPDFNTALEKFKRHGLEIGPLPFYQIFPKPVAPKSLRGLGDYLTWIYRKIRYGHRKFEMKYPLVGGYSDIFIISSDTIHQFTKYCGVFAAMGLFVELALPTSLVFASDLIKTEDDTELKGRALWTSEEMKILEPYGNKLKHLFEKFPEGHLYLHPVKLSKWDTNDI